MPFPGTGPCVCRKRLQTVARNVKSVAQLNLDNKVRAPALLNLRTASDLHASAADLAWHACKSRNVVPLLR